nr:coatomer subunit delta-like [Ipomoea batatas]
MPPRHHDASTAVPPQPPTLTLTPSNRPRLKGKGSKANLFFGLIPSLESCCYLPETALNRISVELKKQISCSMHLTNKSDNYVAFKVVLAASIITKSGKEVGFILEDLETLRLVSKVVSFIFLIASVPEYSYSLDEEGICKTAFELLFAFDEVISLGHKENINVVQLKQYCEMESHEEKLHKLVLQSKINETSEIDKSKIEKNRGGKGGFMSLQSLGSSGRLETGFGNDTNQSSTGSGFGNSGSGFGLSGTDVESFSTKSKEGVVSDGLQFCYQIPG